METAFMKKAALVPLLALALCGPALGDEAKQKKADPAKSASQAAPMAEGEVRRVDKDAKKITLKHGPLQKLDMPPMTMVFQVGDAKLLEGLKAGDKVMFQAEKINGRLFVTEIRPAK
jgi:Cu/Ag efflux protein CusF